jgi:hypothetical protein
MISTSTSTSRSPPICQIFYFYFFFPSPQHFMPIASHAGSQPREWTQTASKAQLQASIHAVKECSRFLAASRGKKWEVECTSSLKAQL